MMQIPSPQADAALAVKAANDIHLAASQSGDTARIAEANAIFVSAEHRRRELSDPRYRSNGVPVWWRREDRYHQLSDGLRHFLQGGVPLPLLVTLDPDYRALSDDEAAEVLNKGTLAGLAVEL